jgi:hypothetical protein
VRRVPILVEADDPISVAGRAAKIREQPELEIVELPGPDTVAVIVAEEVDEQLLKRCGELVRGCDARLVLVVSRMRGDELSRVIECGVSAVLWRREATAPALLATVHGADRGDGALPSGLLERLLVQVGRA